MSGKATLIVKAKPNPNEQEAMENYRNGAVQLLKQAGGNNVQQYGVSSTVIGEDDPMAIFTMDFPSVESVQAVFDSSAYKELIPFRDKAYSSIEAFVTKAMEN